ncbi:hypothetical protein LJ737_21825 [Hymenobacter sp. 15J16-1T3B]|uniref:DUF3592 domain-containing protein n=1 Tax=Hymenobacter sp. 15J16-1T3B TaxID=2886941 RepID=UPI001D10CC28|nr:hypothetical protein [Hymenobacter sp. 15J16-1T3B]MCC3159895.1 hypothetical protein [Hymenobacter sp. 15J16-1T3B]
MQTPPSSAASTGKKQLLVGLFVLALGIAALAGVITWARRENQQKRALILKNPGVTTGIITRRRTHKNRGVNVTYRVGGREYRLSARTSRAFLRSHQQGDTTAVVYAKADPSEALLKATLLREKN